MRIAAGSILLLSVVHVLFWAVLAVAAHSAAPVTYPTDLLFPVACVFSVGGLFGVFAGIGVLQARAWARVAALVAATFVVLFCGIGIFVLALTLVGLSGLGLGIEVPTTNKTYFVVMGLAYFSIFLLALWWIYVFSRKSTASQFSSETTTPLEATSKKPSCPPPVALLAWLMIISSGLSALSWPLILGKIPAMLFTHVFSMAFSKWIWAANILAFLACGISLLKLRRWSYAGTIGLHVFWLVSTFVSQLSSNFERYLSACYNALGTSYSEIFFIHVKIPAWIAAFTTAIPTALLIAGLFYYRSSFLKATTATRE
ncbi:MAG TPA: hypothetical protein VKD70_13650 [Candidatus Acidoferrum sp.]|nr:hypothetical protein [Candidatus Acidoferrum sp.]